ncbi:MAG: hypothetical protein ACM3O9_07860 [Methylocystaceae bacterium]
MPRCRHMYMDRDECWCIHYRDHYGDGGNYSVKRSSRKKLRSR